MQSIEGINQKNDYFCRQDIKRRRLFYQPETKLLENVVAIALFKKYGTGLYFYNRNIEVDFVVPQEGIAIQVCYSMADERTVERETAALVALNKYKPMATNLIVTFDEERIIQANGIEIHIVPAWRWLLE